MRCWNVAWSEPGLAPDSGELGKSGCGFAETAVSKAVRLSIIVLFCFGGGVGADGSTDESGFDCAMSHSAPEEPSSAALIVGMPDKPLDTRHHALIRLHYLEGMDKDSCPSIVCCGGRMEFHGAPMGRTWLKLASTAAANTTIVELQEDPQGWRFGDRIILTATTRQNKIKKTFKPSTRDSTQTEERIIASSQRPEKKRYGVIVVVDMSSSPCWIMVKKAAESMKEDEEVASFRSSTQASRVRPSS